MDELSNFEFLFDIISLNESYLYALKPQSHFYNEEVSLYGTNYYLSVDDDNRGVLKVSYPSFIRHDNEAVLELEGTGRVPWSTMYSTVLRVMFDIEGNNHFSARVKFSSTDKFNELFVEE